MESSSAPGADCRGEAMRGKCHVPNGSRERLVCAMRRTEGANARDPTVARQSARPACALKPVMIRIAQDIATDAAAELPGVCLVPCLVAALADATFPLMPNDTKQRHGCKRSAALQHVERVRVSRGLVIHNLESSRRLEGVVSAGFCPGSQVP